MIADFFAAIERILHAGVWSELAAGLIIAGGLYLVASIWPGLVHIGQVLRPPRHRIGDEMRRVRAVVKEWAPGAREGLVSAEGELWRASSDEPLNPGDVVSVAAMDGLALKVRRRNKRR